MKKDIHNYFEIKQMGYLEESATLSLYYKESLNNDCLYIYVIYRFGWGIRSPLMIAMLYNTINRILSFSIMETDVETKELKPVLSSHDEKDVVVINDDNWVDKLFNCMPQNQSDIYDVDNYSIFLKKADGERWLFILDGHQDFYKPFEPIFEIVRSCIFGLR